MKIIHFFKDSALAWNRDKAPRLAAALSYYTLFSLAPILLILVTVAKIVLGKPNVQQAIFDKLNELIGFQGADFVHSFLQNNQLIQPSWTATILGVCIMLFVATGMLSALQDALNTIWGVELKPKTRIKQTFMQRILSFGIILAAGFALLVSMGISAIVSAISNIIVSLAPTLSIALPFVDICLSLLIITCLFSTLYKLLPDVRIAWKDAYVGGFISAILFTVGKWIIGWYVGQSTVASAYGAAGSLFVLLLWIYYNAQIFFFGAECTKVYAKQYGSGYKPAKHAQSVASKIHIHIQQPTFLTKILKVGKRVMVEYALAHGLLKIKRFFTRRK